jgi:hypothetical protein
MNRPSRAVAIPLPTSRPLAPATADALAAGVFAGAVGASLFALFFLVLDLLRGEALATPALVGAVVLQGASALQWAPVDLGIVGAYSLVHAFLFASFATLASLALVRMRTIPDLPVLALVLALGLEGGFLVTTGLLAPGLGATIGHGVVLAGNAVAGITMAVILRRELAL